MRKQVFVGLLSGSLLWLAQIAAPAQPASPYFTAVTNLGPAFYWPLNEAVAPPVAQVETNYGSLGPIADAFYSCGTPNGSASATVIPGSTVHLIPGDSTDTDVDFSSGTAGGFLGVPLNDQRVALSSPQFSVEAWVYPTNANGVGIVSQTGPEGLGTAGTGGLNGGTNSAGWALDQDFVPSQNSGNLQGFSFHVFNGNNIGGAEALYAYTGISGTAFAVAGQWFHLVATFDGTNAVLYVNGTNGSGSSGYQIPMTGTYARDTWDPLFIGATRGFNNNRFGGAMAHVAIYTNVLSPTQVATHYAAGNNPSTPPGGYFAVVTNDNPYMYWQMNAPASYPVPALASLPVATNYGVVTPAQNATYNPGTFPGLPGPAYAGFGGSSTAVGINGITYQSSPNSPTAQTFAPVDLPYSKLMDPTGNTNSFTVVGWFKCNQADANGRFECIAGHSDSSWRVALNNGNIRWNYGGSGDSDVIINAPFPPNNGTYNGGPTINVNDGNWHQFVGGYNSTNQVQFLVIDGAEIATSANAQLIPGKSNLDPLLGGAPDNVNAGYGNSYNQRYFPGSIAHFAFFTNALSTNQVLALYAAAQPPPTIFASPSAGPATNSGTTTATFTVGASGAQPLAYQWYFAASGATNPLADDSVHITGSLSNVLVITNLVAGESGSYFVVVTNSYGSATSSLAGLVVSQAPLITAQNPSANFSLDPGWTSTLSVTAVGSPTLSYQWYTNGTPDLANGQSATYTLSNVTSAQSGTAYYCVVGNTFGSATNTTVQLTVTGLPGNSYAVAVTALNPVGYWPMHETAPAAPGDIETNYGSLGALGNGYYADWDVNSQNPGNLAVMHGQMGALPGDPDTAAGFTRQTGAYLLVPHTSPLLTLKAPLTLEAWVQAYDQGFGVILGEGGGTGLNGGANYGGFSWNWAGTANTFSLTVYNGSGTGSSEPKTSANSYFPGTWYHLVSTFDGTNVTYYVNGSPVGLQNSSAATMAPDSWSPLIIGGGRWSGNIARQYNGTIDEVAIYTNVLQLTDIAAHYTASTAAAPAYKNAVLANNPLLYYRMDSPTFVTPPRSALPVLHNYGSAAVNGVYMAGAIPGGASGPSLSIDGPIAPTGFPMGNLGTDNALQVGGMSSFADAGFNTAYNPTGRTPMSIALWAKGNPAEVARNWQTFAGHTDSGWRCAINGGTGKFGFDCGNGKDVASANVYNDGNWHYVVGTYDGTTTSVYVDGLLTGTGTSSSSISGTTANVILGGDAQYTNNPAGPGRQIAGSVCEVAFWNNVVLSSNQVLSLYWSNGVPPIITQQPVASSFTNQGSAYSNTVVVGGTPILSYQWYTNGVPVAGQTNAMLSYNPITTNAQNADYYLIATNAYGSVTSTVASITVYGPPILTQDVFSTNLLLFVGAHPTLSVVAAGAVPLHYQWTSNGVFVAGANTNSLSLTNVQFSYAANYACVITNFVGRQTSSVVTIFVISAPTAPYPQAVLGANPISYWRLNEMDNGLNNGNAGIIANDYWGGYDGTYTNTVLGLSGYSTGLAIQDGYSPATDPGTTAALFGNPASADSYAGNIPVINFAAPTNQNVAFSVETWVNCQAQSGDNGIVTKGYGGAEQFDLDTGSDAVTPSHAFRFLIRDASGNTHFVASTNHPDSNWHHLVGVCDEFHGAVTLYVDGESAGQAIIPAGSGILSSTNPVSFGSRMGGVATDYNFQLINGYMNDVAIYNYALSSTQVVAHYLAAGIPPSISRDIPSTTNVDENGLLMVPLGVFGSAPLQYQWVTNSTAALGGATNATLVMSNYPAAYNGYTFQATVSNLYGSAQSSAMSVYILSGLPVIVRDLASQVTAVSGSTYTYAVQATGTEPFQYYWFDGNTQIAGQSESTYTLPAAAGAYSVVVSNVYGAVTSTVSTITLVSPLTDNYSTSILSLGAVAYWPLNETNPPPAADIETNLGSFGALGNAYYVYSGAVSKQTPGALAGDPDTAVTLGGVAGSWLGVPRTSPNLTLSNAFSVECWVNPADSNFAAIVSQTGPINGAGGLDGGPNSSGWSIYENGGSQGNFSFHVYDGITGGGSEPKLNVYSINTWYHVVGVWDGVDVNLYIDGTNNVNAQAQPTQGYSPNYWSPVEIGASGINNYMFNGSVDEVAIYNYALTPAQIGNHYNVGINPAATNYHQVIMNDNPYLYYRLDSPQYTPPSSNTYPQAVNYGTLGPNQNALYQPGTVPGVAGLPTLGLGGAQSRAVAINGLNSCVDAGYNVALDPSGSTTPFSVIGWFQADPTDGNGRWTGVFSHGDQSWRYQLNDGTNAFNYGGNAGGGVPDSRVPLNANDGNWHMFAGVYDGLNYTAWLDLATNTLNSLANVPGTNLDILIGGAPDNVSFGANGTFNERFFPGRVSHVAFFTNALTSAQILQVYNLGTNNTPSITISRSGGNVVINYVGDLLLQATNVAGPYTQVPNASSPYIVPLSHASTYYRAARFSQD